MSPTYYEQPVLKEPTWIWSVPVYLFVGGIAGASSTLAAAARALDRRGQRRLIRHAHRISVALEVVSAGLLVHDLGRPSRFLYMLRVFRPTSPMSIGSWTLTGAGGTSTLAALLEERPGAPGKVGALAGYGSGLLGLVLSGYTAVLLTNTAVPVWQGGRRALPPLFLASSMASAGSLLSLLDVGRRGRVAASRFALAGNLAAALLAIAFEREVARTPRAARPLRQGASGALWSLSRAFTAGSAVASIAARDRLAATLGLWGSLALRVAVFVAGKRSARDPRATFWQQREAQRPQSVQIAPEVTTLTTISVPDEGMAAATARS